MKRTLAFWLRIIDRQTKRNVLAVTEGRHDKDQYYGS